MLLHCTFHTNFFKAGNFAVQNFKSKLFPAPPCLTRRPTEIISTSPDKIKFYLTSISQKKTVTLAQSAIYRLDIDEVKRELRSIYK